MHAETFDGFRLSPQQRHLWLLQPEVNTAYCCQIAVRVEGQVEKEQLKAALQRVVDQHEILRTKFRALPGMNLPVQVITESGSAEIHESDLSHLDAQSQEQRLAALFEAGLQSVSDAPLHVSLVRLATECHILLLRLPALYADSATVERLVAEMVHEYETASDDEAVDDEAMQYADVSEWLNEMLESEETEAGRTHWQNQDLSTLFTVKLPGEKQTATDERFVPQSTTVTITPALVKQLEAFAQAREADVSDMLLAAWTILLRRLSGEQNLIIGVKYDGRPYEELEETLGLFAKYLPIPFSLDADAKFAQILTECKKTVLDNYERQLYFSWEQMREWLATTAEPYTPINFEFMDVTESYRTGDVSFSVMKKYSCVSRFRLKLTCELQADGSVSATFYYDTSRFDASGAAIERLAAQFLTLLESAVSDADATIVSFPILSSAERHQLLVAFNSTYTEFPEEKCFHHLFEEQVQRTPDNVAVVYSGESLTYAELNAKANQLAHHLIRLGVAPETRVGICIERSLEMMIGLLGVLKAGGAYVPLDPTYPQERLAFMLEDAEPFIVLTQEKHLAKLPNWETTLCLDSQWRRFESVASRTNPDVAVRSDNLAYMIYTSGSTGKPKGTLIVHRGLTNYLCWCTKAYAVAEGTGAPVHSSLGFDATITSLFSPLLVGRKVVLLPEEDEIQALSTVLQSGEAFSLVKITPAHLEILSQMVNKPIAARAFIIGGEALFGKHLQFWQQHAPKTRLINEYGPTETVVGCCVYDAPADKSFPGAVPIGRPIANTQLYILNEANVPVPIGVIGELYIGGAGVARGYLKREALTKERFIENPFAPKGHPGRLYKTGDLARYLPFGAIEFLGRNDFQVKIRGFRIELGEIEAVLSKHPAVRQSVVVARDEEQGKRLVAYVVENEGFEKSELRAYLAEKLPDYMVPSLFVSIDAVPLTPNGKVDTNALPAPDRGSFSTPYVPPSTPTQEALVAIWAEVLNLDRVGINDNFFELGGHSLLATQVISRANQTFKVDLNVRQLFEKPTISVMAEYIDTLLWLAENRPVSNDEDDAKRADSREGLRI